MPAGELSPSERFALDEAIRRAEQTCRYEFSVFVGRAEGDPRAFAGSLHNSLVVPARSILIMVDPAARALEIVTGSEVRRTLSDNETELAALHMRESFAAGDLVGGLKHGIGMLAEHARPPHYLHAD
ncbi:DUF5130 family protein [Nocardioides ferulae]|uniref:DUF5130 family protein n=1 Tax=Nocardioides ferulae TaxID=2340821 RepID=UPI000EB46327|nr:DUF5130 family protein [Nocardioides ferulae]